MASRKLTVMREIISKPPQMSQAWRRAAADLFLQRADSSEKLQALFDVQGYSPRVAPVAQADPLNLKRTHPHLWQQILSAENPITKEIKLIA
jgi:hypothetical protein